MKVLLINPPQPYLVHPGNQQNLGLLYVASAIEKKGKHQVKIADLSEIDNMEIALSTIYSYSPDIVGFSGTTLEYPMNKKIATLLNKKIIKIIGGTHATLLPQSILQDTNYPFDMVIVKEADLDINLILDHIEKTKLNRDMWRIWSCKRPDKKQINELPFPARHLIRNQGKRIFLNEQTGNSTIIISARGCPYNCAFCSSRTLSGIRVRYRKPRNVYNEIKECIEKYNIRNFRFSDDSLTSPKTRILELCKLLKPLKIKWRGSTRVYPNSIKMFKAMKEAGCKELSFGIESGDQSVLNALNKQAKVETSKTALLNAQIAGIQTKVLMMIGTPGETKDTVTKNIDFLKSVPFNTVAIKRFVPMPGSDIWNNPFKYNITIKPEAMKFENLNYFFWEKGNDGNRKFRETDPLIKLTNMTDRELKYNIESMINYLKNKGWMDLGT